MYKIDMKRSKCKEKSEKVSALDVTDSVAEMADATYSIADAVDDVSDAGWIVVIICLIIFVPCAIYKLSKWIKGKKEQ